MDQSEIWRQMVEAITRMAQEKEKNEFVPSTQSEVWQAIVDSVQNQKENPWNKANPFSQELIDGLIEKLEKEKKDKLDLYEAGLKKTKALICKLFQKIDEYVLANEVETHVTEINTILDELGPKVEDRNAFLELIEGLRNE